MGQVMVNTQKMVARTKTTPRDKPQKMVICRHGVQAARDRGQVKRNPRGRPKGSENVLQSYAEQLDPWEPLRLIALACIDRGITPSELAKRIPCDRNGLSRYFLSRKPKKRTIKKIAMALGYGVVVQDALCGELSIQGAGLRIFRSIRLLLA